MTWGELIDQAGGDTGKFDPIPAGKYDFVVKKAEAVKTKTLKRSWKIEAHVEGGPYAGRRVWNQITLSPENPNAMSFFWQNMGILGITKDYLKTASPSDDAVAKMMENKRFKGSVIIDDYQDVARNKIDKMFPARVDGSAPPAPGVVAAPAPPPPAAPAPAPESPLAPPVEAPVAEAPPAPPAEAASVDPLSPPPPPPF